MYCFGGKSLALLFGFEARDGSGLGAVCMHHGILLPSYSGNRERDTTHT